MLVGYLCGNTLAKSFHKSYVDLLFWDAINQGRIGSYAEVGCGPLQLVDGRNKLCQRTLDDGFEWLFMLDSDMGFEPDTLAKLLEVADPERAPVVGGLCFSMREHGSDHFGGMETYPWPTILTWQEHDDKIWRMTGTDHYPVNTMIKVGATGAACILIHRSVLEKMGKDWFTQTKLPDGELEGEDISFCHRCMDHDVPVWVHTGIRTTHYKAFWLSEMDYWRSRIAPPAQERVDVIIPALHRPQNVAPLMQSLRASTGLATAWWVVEPGDAGEIGALADAGCLGHVIEHAGTFAEKVNFAYSRGLRQVCADNPWVLLAGDDVIFRPGWLDQALATAGQYKANVVGTNDLLNPRVMRGEHATHMLIRRSYIDEVGSSWDGPGVVCHEGYHHWFVDDEIVSAAKLRRTFQSSMGAMVEHRHPLNGRVEMDDIYRLGEKNKVGDEALFRRRVSAAIKAESDRSNLRVLEAV